MAPLFGPELAGPSIFLVNDGASRFLPANLNVVGAPLLEFAVRQYNFTSPGWDVGAWAGVILTLPSADELPVTFGFTIYLNWFDDAGVCIATDQLPMHYSNNPGIFFPSRNPTVYCKVRGRYLVLSYLVSTGGTTTTPGNVPFSLVPTNAVGRFDIYEWGARAGPCIATAGALAAGATRDAWFTWGGGPVTILTDQAPVGIVAEVKYVDAAGNIGQTWAKLSESSTAGTLTPLPLPAIFTPPGRTLIRVTNTAAATSSFSVLTVTPQ